MCHCLYSLYSFSFVKLVILPDANPVVCSLSLQRDICGRAFLCTGWAFWDRKWIHLFQSKYRGAWNHKGSTFLISLFHMYDWFYWVFCERICLHFLIWLFFVVWMNERKWQSFCFSQDSIPECCLRFSRWEADAWFSMEPPWCCFWGSWANSVPCLHLFLIQSWELCSAPFLVWSQRWDCPTCNLWTSTPPGTSLFSVSPSSSV